jgi:glutamate decarboxylase
MASCNVTALSHPVVLSPDRVVVRPHINRNVAELLAGDITSASKYLEKNGGNAPPPTLQAHPSGTAAPTKC